ncbi:MAG TPA: pyridoxal 5'-phosphate synthase glutaminase subunit PdxT [Anaerolineaceae bacterium]|nr:pyridoxal 5'-phosphate synthase glutaminase subunit PdxT [Anaerolineaceae bacterium]
MQIGVLALQGDFAEHQAMLESLGVQVSQVRLPAHLEGLQGLIMPGGESTTIGKLSDTYGLTSALRDFSRAHAVWGTCAGAIFMAKDAGNGKPQTLLGVMDIVIARNAFGRQVDSFEVDLRIPVLVNSHGENPYYHTVFIRAPLIESVGKDVETLASLDDGRIVAARQGKLLATSFHPELTRDTRFHSYFLELAK